MGNEKRNGNKSQSKISLFLGAMTGLFNAKDSYQKGSKSTNHNGKHHNFHGMKYPIRRWDGTRIPYTIRWVR